MVVERDGMTFETLSSIYRVEKNANTLSNVRKDLYSAMTELFEEQTRECDRLASTNPESIMYDGASERKKKILQLMKRIVELRMDKISALALRGAMGAVNTIEPLTAEERVYYNEILDSSKRHWSLIDRKKKSAYIPDIAPEPAEPVARTVPETIVPKTLDEMPAIEDVPEDFQEQEPLDDVPVQEESPIACTSAEPSVSPSESRPEDAVTEPDDGETAVIRILETLPVFSGPDRDYDLKKEDVVRLPAIMAKALINREKAVLINVTP
ncbi:MAG: hypothetical protein WCR24_06050 [Candidatus Methanomethylophilaceae archaeon]